MSDRPNFPAQRWQPLDNENIYDQINSNKRASTSVIITKVSYVAQRHFLEHRVHLKAVFFTLSCDQETCENDSPGCYSPVTD